MTRQDHVEPCWQAWMAFGAVLGGALVLAFYLPGLSRHLEEIGRQPLDVALPRLRTAVWQLIGAGLVVALAINIWALKTASAVLRANQVPHPGAWVLRRTRIRTGRAAVRFGWGARVIAVLVWMPPIALAGLVNRLLPGGQ